MKGVVRVVYTGAGIGVAAAGLIWMTRAAVAVARVMGIAAVGRVVSTDTVETKAEPGSQAAPYVYRLGRHVDARWDER